MKKTVLLFIAMLGLAGCPDNKSSRNGLGNGGLVGTCVNCGFNAAVFSQAVTSEIPQAGLTLSIEGDANQMNMWGHSGQNPLFSYQGPVQVTGHLNVVSALPFGSCLLPAGSYSLRTIQAGVYNIGIFQVPAVELIGPVRMIVTLTEGTILTNGNGVITSFGAVLVGQQGPSVFGGGWGYNQYQSPYQSQQNFGMTACGDSVGVRF